jgi:hypothetical protein
MSHLRTGTAVLAPVRSLAEARRAAGSGAQLFDTDVDAELAAAIVQAGLGAVVAETGLPGPGPDLPGLQLPGPDLPSPDLPGLQLPGPDLPSLQWRCADLAAAERTVQRGIAPDRILVRVPPGEIASVADAGWRTLVDADAGTADAPADAELAAARAGAIAAVSAWLGASVVSTRHVAQVRGCLDMTASILGSRPPAWSVRGLA